MKNYDEETAINVGTGTDVSIGKLAEMIRDVVYPSAKIVFDTEKPDGTPRKGLDVSRLHRLGWQHKVDLPEGIAVTYQWYKQACLA